MILTVGALVRLLVLGVDFGVDVAPLRCLDSSSSSSSCGIGTASAFDVGNALVAIDGQ
jgi:hypothetical protein